MRGRWMLWVMVAIVGVIGLWAVASAFAVMGLESAKYTVSETRDGYEIRQYPALLVAATATPKTADQGDSENFQKLAGYIFGGNAQDEKIAMTVPVLIDETAKKRAMTFVLPSDLNTATAPDPKTGDVTVRVQPPRKMAAIRFSWYGTPARQKQMAERLTAMLKRDGIEPAGRAIFATYNPPMTFPPMRRNEMLVPLSQDVPN